MKSGYDIRNEVGIGKSVVFKITGFTGEVYKIDAGGVGVFVKERLQEKEYWPWNTVTKRYPRLVKRYPRPFRYPRLIPSMICHCPKGTLEVWQDEIRCKKCGLAIGTESFPHRIEEATELYRKAYTDDSPKRKRKRKVREGVPEPDEQRQTGSHPRLRRNKKRAKHARRVPRLHGGVHEKAGRSKRRKKA
jgi:hypothetical protein